MQYAIFEGIRSTPIATGQRADCPGCGNEVLSKCGEINIHHWAHLAGVDCDLWSEPETPWHRDWKNRFPEEWREVFIKGDSGEWHRADVAIPGGPVIEFQHSNLNPAEIRKREDFYNKYANGIIWIIDGVGFRDRWVTMPWEDWRYRDKHTKFGYSPFHYIWQYSDKRIPSCPSCEGQVRVIAKHKQVEKKRYATKKRNSTMRDALTKAGVDSEEFRKYSTTPNWDTLSIKEIRQYFSDLQCASYSATVTISTPMWRCVAAMEDMNKRYDKWDVDSYKRCFSSFPHDGKKCDEKVLEELSKEGLLDEKGYIDYDSIPKNFYIPDPFPKFRSEHLRPIRWPHARKTWAYARETVHFDDAKNGVFEWLGTVNDGGKNSQLNSRNALNLPKYIVGTFQSKKDFILMMEHLKITYAKAA